MNEILAVLWSINVVIFDKGHSRYFESGVFNGGGGIWKIWIISECLKRKIINKRNGVIPYQPLVFFLIYHFFSSKMEKRWGERNSVNDTTAFSSHVTYFPSLSKKHFYSMKWILWLHGFGIQRDFLLSRFRHYVYQPISRATDILFYEIR